MKLTGCSQLQVIINGFFYGIIGTLCSHRYLKERLLGEKETDGSMKLPLRTTLLYSSSCFPRSSPTEFRSFHVSDYTPDSVEFALNWNWIPLFGGSFTVYGTIVNMWSSVSSFSSSSGYWFRPRWFVSTTCFTAFPASGFRCQVRNYTLAPLFSTKISSVAFLYVNYVPKSIPFYSIFWLHQIVLPIARAFSWTSISSPSYITKCRTSEKFPTSSA